MDNIHFPHLQEAVGLPDVALQRGSGGEVARPVAVVPRRVREEVVALRGPREVGVVQGLQVAGRGRVKHVDLRPVLLTGVYVPDEGLGEERRY